MTGTENQPEHDVETAGLPRDGRGLNEDGQPDPVGSDIPEVHERLIAEGKAQPR